MMSAPLPLGGRVCSARAPFEVPAKERKKTRLTLAPNRGSLGVPCELIQAQLWNVLGFNPQKHADRHTHVAVTLTLARSTQTHAVRPVRV